VDESQLHEPDERTQIELAQNGGMYDTAVYECCRSTCDVKVATACTVDTALGVNSRS
jgi:hypothetical protein